MRYTAERCNESTRDAEAVHRETQGGMGADQDAVVAIHKCPNRIDLATPVQDLGLDLVDRVMARIIRRSVFVGAIFPATLYHDS